MAQVPVSSMEILLYQSSESPSSVETEIDESGEETIQRSKNSEELVEELIKKKKKKGPKKPRPPEPKKPKPPVVAPASEKQKQPEAAKEQEKPAPTWVEVANLEEGFKNYGKYETLRRAAVEENWDVVKKFIEDHPEALTEELLDTFETILHYVVKSENIIEFVRELVAKMSEKALEFTDMFEMTALSYGAAYGNAEAVKIMVQMNHKLLNIPDWEGKLPIHHAARFGHKDTVDFLLSATKKYYPSRFTHEIDESGVCLVENLITANLYGIALELLKGYQGYKPLALVHRTRVLEKLAQKPLGFASGSQLGFWQCLICIPDDFSPSEVRGGDVEDPEKSSRDYFTKCSAMCKKVHVMLYNTIKRLGKLVPSSRVSGAALQMQRELQWYKVVENFVHPSLREEENGCKLIPREVFTKEHAELVKAGQEWIKDTATSCSVVAALIITVAFAAAITVPGGNDSQGKPNYLNEKSFSIFAISNALALFFSSASVLMFLGILTSRYSEEDFLEALPRKMIIGLFTLFLSIAAMMIAFGEILYLLVFHPHKWNNSPLVLLAILPVTLFGLLQIRLIVKIVRSTYGPSFIQPPT